MEIKNNLEFSVYSDSLCRMDQFLSVVLNLNRTKVGKLIKSGNILLNGACSKSGIRLKQKDRISVLNLSELNSAKNEDVIVKVTNTYIKTAHYTIPIIYNDEDILILNKPSGLLVHEATSNNSDNLVRILRRSDIKLYNSTSGREGIVHRLDQYTEGLIIFAKSKLAYDSLKEQFKNRNVTKKYYAVLKGVPVEREGVIDRLIGRDSSVRARKSCDHFVKGSEKTAITKYKVIEEFTNLVLVDIALITGRTHQIRVHFASIGHPVLGDSLYSKQTQKVEGYYLQSYFVGFSHPKTNKTCEFKLLVSDRLKKYAKSCDYD